MYVKNIENIRFSKFKSNKNLLGDITFFSSYIMHKFLKIQSKKSYHLM